jgi:long-chain acyl-CoA synthetase
MLTIGDCIDHAVRRFASQPCARCVDANITYGEFADRSARLSSALVSLGLVSGDRVAVLAANCHRYLECFVAIPAVGLVIVPLNTRLAVPELIDIVNDCTPRVLITDRSSETLGDLANQFEIIIYWPNEYEALLASTTPRTWQELGESVGVNTLAALFYTGGTTGRSKGVMLTHDNIVTNSFHKTIAVGLRSDEVFLAAPAMFHVAGIAPLLSLLGLGARIIFVPGFDAALCLDTIERDRITVFFPVPTMLAAMVTEQTKRNRDISTLRMLGHAASSISIPSIHKAVASFPGVEIAQFYGATETTAIVTCLHNEEDPAHAAFLGSCGQPVVGVSVRVVDENGVDLPAGSPGEVIISGRNIMAGYWNRPEETAAALQDGWYRSGDIGYLDESDHLYIVDRAKDMIITGAENVYSVEVENVLYAQPGVEEVAVFGVPHATWGEAVHAVVVVIAGANGGIPEGIEADLVAACRTALAGFKVPKSFDIRLDPLPKSGPGKVLKRALRDPYWNADRSPSLLHAPTKRAY